VDEDDFPAAAEKDEDLNAASTDEEGEEEPAPEPEAAPAEAEDEELIPVKPRNVVKPEKSGWLEQRKMSRGFATMGRKKQTWKSLYFVLADGKMTMSKMPNQPEYGFGCAPADFARGCYTKPRSG
jgi:hypothetical protein